jgi:predicted metal-dependent phosphoesterase TrpH
MKWARIELHCHTTASHDGLITPDGLLRAAELQRLDGIAITDHDSVEGAFECQRWFKKKKAATQIFIGEERTLADQCHVIGLFLKEAIQAQTLLEMAAEVREQGGLILMPHPVRKKDGLLGSGRTLPMDSLIHAAEAHNAKSSAADNAAALMGLQTRFPIFGGSDAHYEADVGLCVNEIPAPSSSMEQSLRAMLHGHGPLRILAKAQSADAGERRYAPSYYALKRWLKVPKTLLPLAKQLYRSYWNQRHGRCPHQRVLVYQRDGDC